MTLRRAVLRRTLVGEVAIPPEDEALGPGVAATVDIGPRANTPASATRRVASPAVPQYNTSDWPADSVILDMSSFSPAEILAQWKKNYWSL